MSIRESGSVELLGGGVFITSEVKNMEKTFLFQKLSIIDIISKNILDKFSDYRRDLCQNPLIKKEISLFPSICNKYRSIRVRLHECVREIWTSKIP